MLFKKDSFNAELLKKEHPEKVIKCSNKLANTLIKEIKKGINYEHENGYEAWFTSGFENISIRAEILNQPSEVTKMVTELIMAYFKDKNFKVELDGGTCNWQSMWIKW